jgi:hypothetical protein
MLPILLFSLNVDITSKNNEHLWISSLKSFEILINNDSKCLMQYYEEIIDRLLIMVQYNENMNVRLTALKCLNSLAINSSPNDIIKYQRSICKQLTNCLDDKKRQCRQMAVESRNRWYLLTTKNIEK